jgi:hypothetical protein
MTKDDIIRMVSVSDLYLDEANQQQPMHVLTPKELEHFANLVAKHEREACAKVVEEYFGVGHEDGADCALVIRQRSQA